MSDSVTQYGFTWGPMEVTRITEYRGVRVLSIEVPGRPRIEVRVSPTGRSIRVFRGEKELA